MRLLVIRHGKAEEDAPSGLDRDRALAGKGERQAQWLGERLAKRADFAPAHIISSPFARAHQTAQRVADGVGLAHDAIVLDDRLGLEHGSESAITELVRELAAQVEPVKPVGQVEQVEHGAGGSHDPGAQASGAASAERSEDPVGASITQQFSPPAPMEAPESSGLAPIAAIVGHQPLLETVIGVLTRGPAGRGPRVRTGECWVLDGPDEEGLWSLGPSLRSAD